MWLFILSLSSLVVYNVAQTDEQLASISTTNPAVQGQILALINDCRRNCEPKASNMLKAIWSPEAAQTAEKWAKQCTFSHSKIPDRTIEVGYFCGENLYMTSYFSTWNEAINAFCNEKNFFIYGKGAVSANAVTGHYTQLVWYNSYKVGCYVAFCPSGIYKLFFVCHMWPAGNIGDAHYPYNSGSSCGECPNNCDDRLCTNPCKYNDILSNCKELKNYCNNNDVVKTQCKGSCNCKVEIV